MKNKCRNEQGLAKCPYLTDNRPDIQVGKDMREYPVFSKSCSKCGVTAAKSHFTLDQHDLIELENKTSG